MNMQPPSITVNENDFNSVVSRLKSMPDAVRMEVLDEASAYATEVLAGETPGRVDHSDTPYIWNSEKQRRAYFATDGFGGGIPSTRSGALESGWSADVTPYGAKITNEAAYAGYVVGEAQQLGHKADGWKLVADTLKGKLSFQSSKFRSVVMSAVKVALGKVKLG